jgi:hypothetical protein
MVLRHCRLVHWCVSLVLLVSVPQMVQLVCSARLDSLHLPLAQRLVHRVQLELTVHSLDHPLV